MLADYLNPQAGRPRNPDEHQALKGRWTSFLQNPDTKAALIQFGVNMLQPAGVGQTFFGQFGQAVGAAGETVAGRQKQRSDMAAVDANRMIDIAGLRLRQDEQQRLREGSAADEAYRTKDLDLKQQGIDVDVINANANLTRAGQEKGELTASRILSEKSKARASWESAKNEAIYDTEGNYITGGTTDDFDTYWKNWATAVGLDPAIPTASTPPPNRAPVSATPPSVSGLPTAAQVMADPRFAQLKAELTNPDPARRAAAEERIRQTVADPDILLQAVQR